MAKGVFIIALKLSSKPLRFKIWVSGSSCASSRARLSSLDRRPISSRQAATSLTSIRVFSRMTLVFSIIRLTKGLMPLAACWLNASARSSNCSPYAPARAPARSALPCTSVISVCSCRLMSCTDCAAGSAMQSLYKAANMSSLTWGVAACICAKAWLSRVLFPATNSYQTAKLTGLKLLSWRPKCPRTRRVNSALCALDCSYLADLACMPPPLPGSALRGPFSVWPVWPSQIVGSGLGVQLLGRVSGGQSKKHQGCWCFLSSLAVLSVCTEWVPCERSPGPLASNGPCGRG